MSVLQSSVAFGFSCSGARDFSVPAGIFNIIGFQVFVDQLFAMNVLQGITYFRDEFVG